MQLIAFQARQYRNIVDSGRVKVAPDVTCLVGQNESGKTALLSAVYRFNPAYARDGFVISDDYPRWRLVKDRGNGIAEGAQPITCDFELSAEDLAAVAEVLGPEVVTSTSYQRSVGYQGSTPVGLAVNELRAVANVFAALGTPGSLSEALSGVTGLAGLGAAAEGLDSAEEDTGYSPEQVTGLVRECRERLSGHGSTMDRVAAILREREPKFFYFNDYQGLPGRIDVNELAGDEEPGASPQQTSRALLKLANTSAAALTAEDFESSQAELEAVSNELTQEVLEFWTQNPALSVEIRVDKVTVGVPQGQQAVARYLDVRVKDSRHGYTNNFSRRSSGFQWFFSFLAAFSEFKDYPHGLVVLLDEPALTLHGRAQADFLRFIEDRLAPEAQVIYTTHSPFMVDPAHMDRVRIVEDRGPKEGSVVTDETLGVTGASLFPLQAALGYDIAQNLFVGPDNLVVEGTSDFTYLTLISDYLKEQQRSHLNERWRILPAGGATNVPAFVALMGNALQVTVLIDGGTSGVEKLKAIAQRGLLADKRLLLTDSFTDGVAPSDIEDLFAPDDYLKLYNVAFSTTLTAADLNGSDRIISRLSRVTGKKFTEHGRPADALLRGRDTLLPALSTTTLNRFEQLFEASTASSADPRSV